MNAGFGTSRSLTKKFHSLPARRRAVAGLFASDVRDRAVLHPAAAGVREWY
jgi:hypothetical protein